MALDPADFLVELSPQPINVVLGTTTTANLSFSNTSATERGYNLFVEVILPDGVSFVDATISPSSVVPGPNGTIIITWIDLTDLAPNQLDYDLGLTLQSDETFRETGDPVPFDNPLNNVVVSGTVDTLPRGDDDFGNIKIEKTDQTPVNPLRYDLQKSAPAKITKGAGENPPPPDPFWPYEYTLIVSNNTVSPSTVTLIDHLPNGVKYIIGSLNVSGPDSGTLSSPTITTPTPPSPCQDYVTIDWGSITLSAGSVNTITFDAAIWNYYTENCIENSGDKIEHLDEMENVATLDGVSGPVVAETITDAMDTVINKSVASGFTDVGYVNNYTLSYGINQYDDVDSVVITDTIGDGQSYNVGSASTTPDSVTYNPTTGETVLVWTIPSTLTTKTSSGLISFTTTTNAFYANGDAVSAEDTLVNNVTINGNNVTTSTPTPDSSGVTIVVMAPSITKEVLGYYYKDGTPKPFNIASPGDEIEFKIEYSSIGLTSDQMNIEIDEYAPANMGPLTASLPITYGGTLGTSFTPVTVSPNGLRWGLGNVPGNSLWTATFKIPVDNIVFDGARTNLAKLAGENSQGLAYSDRDVVDVTFGQPNITLEKTVDGPAVNNIKFGEIYTYTITIENPQNSEGTVTDAFELDLTDVIPDDLTYVSGSEIISTTGTVTYNSPSFIGQDVSLLITQLAPDATLTFEYDVLVGMVVSDVEYTNLAVLQQPYSQPDRSFQYPGDPLQDSTTLITQSVDIDKIANPTSAKIGDLVTYTITVTVPLGTVAYDLQVVDFFPDAKQEYQVGTATKDGSPITPISVSNGVVTFPNIPLVDATTSTQTIVYTFQVRVIDADHVPPFTEIQENQARVRWKNRDGDQIGSLNTMAQVTVRTPNVISLKEQRNVTKGGPFTTLPLNYDIGDLMEYRLSLTNNGAETAFNTTLTDVIDPFLQAIAGSITPSAGTASLVADTITWIIPTLPVTQTETITFLANTLPGVPPGNIISNFGTYDYNTNDNGFGITYGPETTNIVDIVAPDLGISKEADILNAIVGDAITYTVRIPIPAGIIIYNFQLTDVIPVGQEYNNNATLDGVPTTGEVSGNTVAFPVIPIIDTMSGAIVLTYIFESTIVSVGSSVVDYQTNVAIVNYFIDPVTPAPPMQDDVTIAVVCSRVCLYKQQRICSKCTYLTDDPICVSNCNAIEYSLIIINCCPSCVYDVIIEDILPLGIEFVRKTSNCKGKLTIEKTATHQLVTWELSELVPNKIMTAEFEVKLTRSAPPILVNEATGSYLPQRNFPRRIDLESNVTVLKNMYYKTIDNIDIDHLLCNDPAITDTSGCIATIDYTDKRSGV